MAPGAKGTMKAIVLAGGYAKRLWPLTHEQAKPLVDINGRPIISYLMDKLENSGHIDGIIISTNEKFQDDFTRWLAAQRYKTPVKIVAEKSDNEGEKLGAVGGMHFVLENQGIEDEVLVIGGDNLISLNVDEMIAQFKRQKKPMVAVYNIKNLQEVKRLGEVVIDADGKIVRFKEKPEEPESTLVSTCCYLFPSGIAHELKEYITAGNNKDAPGFFIDWLSRRTEVFGHVFDTYWFDIGDKTALERAREFAEKNL